MRSFGKICGIIILITFLGVSVVMAVGYEKYDSAGNPISKMDNESKQDQSMSSAIEKATFAKKYPQIIDEVTVYIRDVLSQFGLTDNKTQ
ncbi:MAG: hypothetical protein M0T73_10065 [Deltaproteobacteria bacterium]|nr:hypothetical protein [Deltaproteobacteria bacterium]